MGTHKISLLCYTDDAVLFAESEDDLQKILQAFNNQAEILNMKVSTDETKCMTIAKEALSCKLSMENNTIDQVMSFKYLGCKTTSSGFLVSEVRKQAHEAADMSGPLRYPICTNTNT